MSLFGKSWYEKCQIWDKEEDAERRGKASAREENEQLKAENKRLKKLIIELKRELVERQVDKVV